MLRAAICAGSVVTAVLILSSPSTMASRSTNVSTHAALSGRGTRSFENTRADNFNRGTRHTRDTPIQTYPDTDYAMSIAYYSVRADQRTSLTLNNKATTALSVRVTLYSRAGTRFVSDGHIVGARSFIDISLNDLVIQAGPSFEDGSIRVSYTGQKMQLGGLLTVRSQRASTGFDEQLMYPPTDKSSSLHGIWWLPRRTATARLVVTNITNATITATVVIRGAGQTTRKQESVAPWALLVLDIPDSNGPRKSHEHDDNAGSISVTHDGPSGGLIGRTLVMDGQAGFSAVIPLSDPAQSKTTTLHGAGIRLRQERERLRPVVILANVGDQHATVSGRVHGTSNGLPVAVSLSPRGIAPGETVLVDNGNQWQRTFDQDESKGVGLELSYDTAPGTVVAYVMTVSGNLDHSFRVPMVDPKAMPSSTGGYFWKADSSRDTVVIIKNTTDVPQRFNLLVRHASGNWAPGLRTIDAHNTVTISLNDVRRSQSRDLKGRVLPTNAVSGQIHWSGHGAPHALVGRVEQFDLDEYVSSTYACPMPTNDNYESSWIEPDTTQYIYTGEDIGFTAWEQDRDAYNSQLEEPYVITDILTWSSYNPSIASSVGGGWFLGQGAGQASITAYGDSNGWDDWQGGEGAEHVPINLYGDLFVQAAYPMNFRKTSTTYFNGTSNALLPAIFDYYTWDSSSGNRAHLGACEIWEDLDYGTWDAPPFYGQPTDKQLRMAAGTDTSFEDTHATQAPILLNSGQPVAGLGPLTQKYQFRCTTIQNGALQDISGSGAGPHTVTRQTTVNGSNWFFSISKHGSSASCQLRTSSTAGLCQ